MHSINSKTLRKVPEVTAVFWAAKLFTTAMGEATSDWLVNRFNPYLAVLVGGIALAIALWIQFRAPKYHPVTYWFAAAMVAVFGTMAADGVHVQLGVPYTISSIVFALALATVFILWHRVEGTLSIHTVTVRRREVFYWLTVIATFALGTALGDLTANTFGFGYFPSALLFIGIILIPTLGYRFFNLNEITAFWSAYVVTRPLGASFADWMAKPQVISGLNWGDEQTAILLFAGLACVIAYMLFDSTERRLETRSKA